MEALAWVEDARPEADAKAALARGDTRLFGIASRVTVLPGVPSDQYATYTARCGVKLLRGSGDQVYGARQLERMEKMTAYAKRYNRIVMDACR